jgi:hypothetical protein
MRTPFVADFENSLLAVVSVFGLDFGLFGGDDDGGGYFVVGVEVEELDAGGAAAGGAYERKSNECRCG